MDRPLPKPSSTASISKRPRTACVSQSASTAEHRWRAAAARQHQLFPRRLPKATPYAEAGSIDPQVEVIASDHRGEHGLRRQVGRQDTHGFGSRARNSVANPSRRPARRATSTIFMRSAARTRAKAGPMPLEAPVACWIYPSGRASRRRASLCSSSAVTGMRPSSTVMRQSVMLMSVMWKSACIAGT